MDTTKLKEIFGELKNLLGSSNSGAQWTQPGRAREQAQPVVRLAVEGGADEETIVAVAEETRLYALGLADQPRLVRRYAFMCGAEPVTEPHRLGASMILDGRQFYLNHLLRTSGMPWLIGQRCLLALGEHTGRKVKVAWKLQDGPGCQICHEDRRKYLVVRHTATFIELDQAPEPYGTGYLVISFL